MSKTISVLIVGIGAGSLGLEISKALRHVGGYRLIGTDIAEDAYGLYGDEGFEKTYLVRPLAPKPYAEQLLKIAVEHRVDAIAPGAEEVHRILADQRDLFENEGILLMVNSREVLEMCGKKSQTLAFLKHCGVEVPETINAASDADIAGFTAYPCVIKPNTISGGSNLVFIAEDGEEALFLVNYLKKRGYDSTLQHYVDSAREFTVGLLSSPTGEFLGSTALERTLRSKLSSKLTYGNRVISSGWSQGRIDDFPEVRTQAERIATMLNNRWAMNVQGRLGADGVFYPFDINPRHSGTTYLRALAGFNEPHILLQNCFNHSLPQTQPPRAGWYLRAFVEKFVGDEEMRSHG